MYLFVIYGLFILLLLGIFFFFTYTHYRKNALEEARKDLENMCASVENSVETQLNNISTISMNIVYSNAVKSNFKEFSAPIGGTERTRAVWRPPVRRLWPSTILSPRSSAPISRPPMSGSTPWTVPWRILAAALFRRLGFASLVRGDHGAKRPHVYQQPGSAEGFTRKGGNKDSQKFISLVRLFLDTAGQPEGIVEVIQDCDTIFSLATQLENQNPDSRVYIYNSRKELVYPYNDTKVVPDYYGLIERRGLPENTGRLLKTDAGENLLFTYRTTPDYNWTVILTKPKAAIYEPLNTFRVMFALIGIFSILLTLLICFYISERLTAPLRKLTAATGKITINRVLDENKVNLTSADSNITELSMLCESIRSMYEKLRSTSQEVLLSQSEETRAKLQATQSLINPHFLYNSLTNISVMAEEEMNEDIIQMCQALCDYFRYISSSSEMIVPLKRRSSTPNGT